MLRQAGTEPAFTGEYTDTKTDGRLLLPRLRRGAVPLRHEVRVALRLAVLLRPEGLRRGRADRGPLARHGAAPRCGAPAAARTSGTSSRARAIRRRRTSGTASTASRCGWCRWRNSRLGCGCWGVSCSGPPGQRCSAMLPDSHVGCAGRCGSLLVPQGLRPGRGTPTPRASGLGGASIQEPLALGGRIPLGLTAQAVPPAVFGHAAGPSRRVGSRRCGSSQNPAWAVPAVAAVAWFLRASGPWAGCLEAVGDHGVGREAGVGRSATGGTCEGGWAGGDG